MRMLFFGTDEFAIPSLERLVEHRQDILACITQPPRPQGRGLKPLPSPVKTAARRLRVPVEEPEDLRGALPQFQQLKPDAGVVIAYGKLIPQELLTMPAHGMLGVHPSLLPQYRGASPIAFPLLQGDATTGVTIFRLNERLDAGEIAHQRTVPIRPGENAAELSDRLATLGAELLLQTVQELEQGSAAFRAQDETLASYAPKLKKSQGRIDWHRSAREIERLVRAMAPWPGAYTHWQGQMLKIVRVSVRDTGTAGGPARRSTVGGGTITLAEAGGIAVATSDGEVVIHELQPAGKRRMTAQELLAGHPMRVGSRLASDE